MINLICDLYRPPMRIDIKIRVKDTSDPDTLVLHQTHDAQHHHIRMAQPTRAVCMKDNLIIREFPGIGSDPASHICHHPHSFLDWLRLLIRID